ncbi:hypothetical protein PtA15_12A128 [Puccinia triticina]|uniref:Uncharacterized protein n=1 Tax=Puccinia triticina TaxID=208348 RepID=A0ABY7D0C3_9BASI|nr:uncharacterized protein PtA15_12A128 [Puccinia triticina]WAQ90142.1 hypothetical protein PtA15_12A128 [Puccinia triticina]
MNQRILFERLMSLRTAPVGSEENPRRSRWRRVGVSRARQAMAVAAPARRAVPVPEPNHPRAASGKPHAKLPFVDGQAKEMAHRDLRRKALGLPTAHPAGPRHPRVYTLIGRGNLARPSERGTPSVPARSSQGVLPRRNPRPLLPAASDVGPSRRERTQGRSDPYPSNRPSRAGAAASRGN